MTTLGAKFYKQLSTAKHREVFSINILLSEKGKASPKTVLTFPYELSKDLGVIQHTSRVAPYYKPICYNIEENV